METLITRIPNLVWNDIISKFNLILITCMINRQWYYNCYELNVHHNIYITKLWDLRSYFLYLHGFILTLFSPITYIFRWYFNVSNFIQTLQNYRVESSTKYSIVIYNYFSYILSCILSPLLYKCSLSVVKPCHDIFHSGV